MQMMNLKPPSAASNTKFKQELYIFISIKFEEVQSQDVDLLIYMSVLSLFFRCQVSKLYEMKR